MQEGGRRERKREGEREITVGYKDFP